MENTGRYEEYINDIYENLTELSQNTAGKTYLAKHKPSGKIVVKKKVSKQVASIKGNGPLHD